MRDNSDGLRALLGMSSEIRMKSRRMRLLSAGMDRLSTQEPASGRQQTGAGEHG